MNMQEILIILGAGLLSYATLKAIIIIWKEIKLLINPPSKIKEFLEKECKSGEYVMMSIFVSKDSAEELLEHMDKFRSKAGVVGNETGEGVVLGMNNKLKAVKELDKPDK